MEDKDFEAFANSVGAPAADTAQDPDFQTFASSMGAQQPSSVSHPVHTHAPGVAAPSTTRFKQAAQPSTGLEPSWGDTLESAAKNAIPSVGGALGAIGHAVTHPTETLGNIGDLAQGAASQAIGAAGFQQDPKEKAKTEALINALENHYQTVYGSEAGFKKALGTDPASIAMDAAAALGGAGSVAKIAGLTKTAAALGTAGSLVDPVQAALKVASVPVKAGVGALRSIQGAASGVPHSLLKVAEQAGASSDPLARTTFNRFASGEGTPEELQQAAQQALASVKQDMSDRYLAGKADLSTEPVDLAPVYQTLKETSKKINMGASMGNPQAKKALADIRSMLDEAQADPAKQTLPEMDALKKQIWDLHNVYGLDQSQSTINSAYHAVRDSMAKVDPNYTQLMEQYQEGLKNVNDLTKTLGLGDKTAATQAAIKMFRAIKTNTVAGAGEPLVKQLAEKNPMIPYMLAGTAAKPWAATGLRNVGEGLGAMSIPLLAIVHPGAAAGLAGAAALGSSKIASYASYGAGALGRNAAKAAQYAKPAYYAGRADQEQQSPADEVFGKMLQIESGNKQFDPHGKPITSPKGAVGAAQVLPSTAPEAAELAGEKFDPNRLMNDRDYNVKLGRAYYNKQLEEFSDPYKAAAAYNAGPEAVRKAIAEHGDEYVAGLPPETQDYMRKLGGAASGGRIERASGGKVDVNALVERLMKRWRQAKRETDNGTKALLNAPDEAIVRALKVAQRSI